MLYTRTASGQSLFILEPGELVRLRMGRVLKNPDETIFLTYAPDLEWLKQQMVTLIKEQKIDVEELEQLLLEGSKRDAVVR